MVIFSFREQTLTNIIQGVRNYLTWEKELTPPPGVQRPRHKKQTARSREITLVLRAHAKQQQQAQPRSISAENTGIVTAPLHSCREKARVVKRHKERKPYA